MTDKPKKTVSKKLVIGGGFLTTFILGPLIGWAGNQILKIDRHEVKLTHHEEVIKEVKDNMAEINKNTYRMYELMYESKTGQKPPKEK